MEDSAPVCGICLTPAVEPAHPLECETQHTYCLRCLQRWARSRTQAPCPLCQVPITHIVHADGNVEPAACTDPSAEDDADLACLDHSIVLSEVRRLQQRAARCEQEILRDAFNAGRRGTAHATAALATLRHVRQVRSPSASTPPYTRKQDTPRCLC